MTPLQDAVMAMLRSGATATKDDWDMPPVLLSLHWAGDGLAMEPWPVDPDIWTMGRPPDVIRTIASRMAQMGGVSGMFTDPMAVGLAVEAFTVPRELAGDPDVERLADDHNLAAHPARIECRVMSVVDLYGASYVVQWNRGAGIAIEEVTELGDDTLGGAVFAALDELAVQVLGITPRPRQLARGKWDMSMERED